MKALTNGGLLIILILTLQYCAAQEGYLLDTVKIDLGNHKSIDIVAENYHERDKWGDIEVVYHQFITDLNKVDGELISSSNSNTMQYDYHAKYRNIQFNSESSIRAEVFVDPEGTIIYFQKVIIKLSDKDELIVKASSLEGLKEIDLIDLNKLIQEADKIVSPDGQRTKKHKSVFLVWEDDQFSDSTTINQSYALDIIELGMGFGLGTLRSNLTPDLEFSLMLGLSKKGRIYHRFGISNQWMFSFPSDSEKGYLVKKDAFLDVVYSMSTRRNSSVNLQTMGLKAGSQISTGSVNFNNDDAYRFGLFRSVGNQIMLEGGIFTYDSFKEFFPYARITWAW